MGLTKAHLKSPIMETYLNVGNTSQADAANWDTRNWQEFTSDVERIFKVNKEQDRQVWKTSRAQEKTLEKKIENLELWQGQISEELKAKKEERKTRRSDFFVPYEILWSRCVGQTLKGELTL